jgi:hypothetical protein
MSLWVHMASSHHACHPCLPASTASTLLILPCIASYLHPHCCSGDGPSMLHWQPIDNSPLILVAEFLGLLIDVCSSCGCDLSSM